MPGSEHVEADGHTHHCLEIWCRLRGSNFKVHIESDHVRYLIGSTHQEFADIQRVALERARNVARHLLPCLHHVVEGKAEAEGGALVQAQSDANACIDRITRIHLADRRRYRSRAACGIAGIGTVWRYVRRLVDVLGDVDGIPNRAKEHHWITGEDGGEAWLHPPETGPGRQPRRVAVDIERHVERTLARIGLHFQIGYRI